jgi:hypothetical protein
LEGSQKQRCTGHAIGVVITADSKGFLFGTGLTDPLNRPLQIWKIAAGIRQLLGMNQVINLSAVEPTPTQHGSEW